MLIFVYINISEHTHTGYFTPTQTGKHLEETIHTTEEDHHIPDYEDRRENEIEARTPTYETEERIPGSGRYALHLLYSDILK